MAKPRGRRSVHSGRRIFAAPRYRRPNPNPRRATGGTGNAEGKTHGYLSFEILREADAEGILYEDYRAKGGRSNDLDWDLKHGFAYVEDGMPNGGVRYHSAAAAKTGTAKEGAMPNDSVLYEKDGSLARIILNRPDDANALDLGMVEALYEAALRCAGDRGVRAVLMSANGPMFSGGGDLKYFRTCQEGGDIGRVIPRMTTYFHGAVSTLNRMEAPVVCAVHATAAGGGLSLAMACDMVFAARSAKFSLAYTAAGLSPDGSSTWFLPRLVGLRRARELMLTNRRFTAEEALDMGIVDRVCDDGGLAAEAEAQARAFAEGPTRAYGSVKRLLLASMGDGLETQMEAEARGIAAAGQSADGIEGIAAFSEKRKPSFRGE